ncbi:MAG: protein kinase [Acidobacteria bacterium]|nr:protein kinase [Acidobacteriota bacterium]
MQPELWEEIERLYHDALNQPAERRDAFLEAVCAGKPALRREVTALLDCDEQATQFLEAPALAVVAKQLAGQENLVAAQPVAGRKVGAYELLAPLGKGGMSEVYLARDPRLGRQVALKLLPPAFTADPERIRRLEQEARSLSALNHPNIVTIYEIGRAADEHYIVEEFVAGKTLRQLLTEAPSQRMNTPQLVAIAVQVADALAVAHEAGVTHRDIKPENVMVRPDGIVKVLDFGLAKLSETRSAERGMRNAEENLPLDIHRSSFSDHPSTMPGTVMGTPRYMSPEQARGLPVDGRTDIFSLGVMLYEMVTGRAPFDGTTMSDILAAILKDEPTPLAALAPDAPPAFVQVINRCLQKDREARYATTRELAKELYQLKEWSQSLAPAQNLTAPRWTRQWQVIAAVTAMILLAAFSYVMFARRTPTASAQLQTLAVLPLKPLSEEKAQSYLGLGIADTIITKVSRINGLIVRPTSAVKRYANEEKDALQAAREQQVSAVLEGTWQRDSDRLRVSVNLLRTSDGTSLWTDQFELPETEIFGLQDKVAAQVVGRLRIQLSTAEQRNLTKKGTQNPAAYDHYAQAINNFSIFHIFQEDREKANKAIEHFQKAIELDPNYALAHAQLGGAYTHKAKWLEHNPALHKSGLRELEIAEQLDPQLAETHVARGLAFWSPYEGYQFVEAIRELRRAQQLDLRAGHLELAEMYGNLGFPEWQTEIERALELDPANEFIKDQVLSLYHINSQPEEMLAAQKRLYHKLETPALYYLTKRMEKEAAPLVAELVQKNPKHTLVRLQRALLLALQGRYREAEELILGLLDRINPGRRHFARILARIYALEGRSDEAVKWLRVSAREGFPNYPAFQRDLYFDGIRNHPAFVQFMNELKTRWEHYRREIG